MSKCGNLRFVLSALILLLCSGPVWSQVLTGTITGTVTDQTGAVVPGAKLEVSNVATGQVRSVTTDEDGTYVVTPLPPGEYSVSAEAGGFKKTVATDIVLEIDETLTVDLVLEIGTAVETVTVTVEVPLLKTADASLGEVITSRSTTELPLNARRFTQLVFLVPGSVQSQPGSRISNFQRSGFPSHVHGSRDESNFYLIDGTDNNELLFSSFAMNISAEVIQEFKVQTGVYTAEFGGASGAVVNLITKAGGNEFHGSVFEFLRNENLDAKNFFDAPDKRIPPFKQNQFGFTLTGPIVRDRTFFTVNYEGYRRRQARTTLVTVPTDAQRTGDFRGGPDIFDPITGLQFQDGGNLNVIPSSQLDPIALQMLAFYPRPNTNQPGGNFVAQLVQRQDEDQVTVRVDHNFSPNSNLYGRFSLMNSDTLDPFQGGATFQQQVSVVPGFDSDNTWNSRNVTIGYAHVFSPRLVTDFRLGYSFHGWLNDDVNAGTNFSQQFGIGGGLADVPSELQGFPSVNVFGFGTLGDNLFNPVGTRSNVYQGDASFSYTVGKHLLKGGFHLGVYQSNARVSAFSIGSFDFTGDFTASGLGTGTALADFLLGRPLDALVTLNFAPDYARTEVYAGYIQDTWRATPKLSLTYGLRYEFPAPTRNKTGRQQAFVPDAAGLLTIVQPTGDKKTLFKTDSDNFQPRIGIAYSLTDKTTLRAGYGLYFNTLYFSPEDMVNFGTAPEDFRFAFSDRLFGLTGNPPWPTNPSLANPLPAAQTISLGSFTNVDVNNFVVGYAQQWTLNIQRQLTPNLVLELAYVGTKGTNLSAQLPLNQIVPGTGARPDPLFGELNTTYSIADSIYHGFEVSARHRFSNGLSFLANYTWSKSIDDASAFGLSGLSSQLTQDFFNFDAERGLSTFDARHRFVFSYVYELPFGKNKSFLRDVQGVADKLLSGWQINGIITLQSGTPVTINDAANVSGSGTLTDRPDQVCDPNANAPHTPEKWFRTECFVQQAAGTFGNAGRTTVTTPGINNWDLAIFKNTYVGERLNVQFRTEFFNVWNHPNFNIPGRLLGAPGFGAISSAKDPRQIQFGLKLLF